MYLLVSGFGQSAQNWSHKLPTNERFLIQICVITTGFLCPNSEPHRVFISIRANNEYKVLNFEKKRDEDNQLNKIKNKVITNSTFSK